VVEGAQRLSGCPLSLHSSLLDTIWPLAAEVLIEQENELAAWVFATWLLHGRSR
jgi:hypothetical protein